MVFMPSNKIRVPNSIVLVNIPAHNALLEMTHGDRERKKNPFHYA